MNKGDYNYTYGERDNFIKQTADDRARLNCLTRAREAWYKENPFPDLLDVLTDIDNLKIARMQMFCSSTFSPDPEAIFMPEDRERFIDWISNRFRRGAWCAGVIGMWEEDVDRKTGEPIHWHLNVVWKRGEPKYAVSQMVQTFWRGTGKKEWFGSDNMIQMDMIKQGDLDRVLRYNSKDNKPVGIIPPSKMEDSS